MRRAEREARGEEGAVRRAGERLAGKVMPEAEARGIKLGFENREALEELPLESDFQFLFRELASPVWSTGTTPATRRSRRTSVSSSTPCTWSPCRPPRRLSYPRCAISRARPLRARHRHGGFCRPQTAGEAGAHQSVRVQPGHARRGSQARGRTRQADLGRVNLRSANDAAIALVGRKS